MERELHSQAVLWAVPLAAGRAFFLQSPGAGGAA